MSSNRYLITGATGFVGSNIVRALVGRNEHVSILVRNKELNWRLHDIKEMLNIYEIDLLSNDLHQVIEKIKPTHIFHLAAYGALPFESDPNRCIETNVKGTINLIESVKRYPFQVFINTGSSSEYGIKQEPMKETDMLIPINDYGVSKAAATLYCTKEALVNSLPIITFRLFAVYGQYEAKTRFIPYAIVNALRSTTLQFSSPENVRDFVHIDDVIRAYIDATFAGNTIGEVFNIGTGQQYSLLDVCDTILKITKSNSLVQWDNHKQQQRQIEPKMWKASIEKIKNVYNWSPELSLKTGLEQTIEWFKNNLNLYE